MCIAGKKLFLFLDTEIGIQNTNIVLFKLAAYIGCVYVGLCWPLTAKNLAMSRIGWIYFKNQRYGQSPKDLILE